MYIKQIKMWGYWIIGLIFFLSLTSTTTYAQAGELDIVFVIDESSSMGNEQQDVKNNVSVIVSQLIASSINGRFGLVGFGAGSSHNSQTTSSGQPHIHTPLTNINTFSTAMDTLTANDGGNELGFQAVSTAVSDEMNFSPTAGKCVVLISDEDADPPREPEHTNQKQQAIADLQARGAIFFSIMFTGPRTRYNMTTHEDYGSDPSSLAQVTGGTFFSIEDFRNDPSSVLEQLTKSCVAVAVPGVICGSKYNDLNGNGIQENNEPSLPDWQIFATDGITSYPPVVTDSNGNYCIQVPPGTYKVEEIQQPPWIQTAPAPSGFYSVTIQAGLTITNINFGNRQPDIRIQGHKFWDLNGNGTRDQITEISGLNIQEPLLDGFTFTLYSGDPNDPTTWSYVAGPVTINDPNQGYVFNDVPPGDYFILEDAVAGWTQTTPSQNGGAQIFTVSGQDIMGLDFGNKPCIRCNGYIMGYKFLDNNFNGVWDNEEADLRVADVQIELVDAFGSILQTTVTDANGLYYFQNVPPGTYTVREQVPAGWVQTAPNNNGGVHTITISQGVNGIGLNFGNYRCDDNIGIIPLEEEALQSDISSPESVYCVLGTKYHDRNSNGVKDGGEGPLEGFAFKLQSTTDPANIHFATSDAFGNFYFLVPLGAYTLSEISMPGWILTTPPMNTYMVTVVVGGGIPSGFEFGNVNCDSANGNGDDCRCDSMCPIQSRTDTTRYKKGYNHNFSTIIQPLKFSVNANSQGELQLKK